MSYVSCLRFTVDNVCVLQREKEIFEPLSKNTFDRTMSREKSQRILLKEILSFQGWIHLKHLFCCFLGIFVLFCFVLFCSFHLLINIDDHIDHSKLIGIDKCFLRIVTNI